ncbi:unnamed protein product [Caenorhabditis brenneri]
MVDRELKIFGNMGVVDIRGLDCISYGTQDAFSIKTVRANNPEWGPAEARPRIKYPQSRHIEFAKVSDIIADYSMNKNRGSRLKKTLRDTIADYVFHFESGKHLFCIHPRAQPEFYYDRTVMNIPRKLTRMHKLPFPQVIIVTENPEDSKRIGRKLVYGRNGRDRHSDRDKVMIGSIEQVEKFILEVSGNRKAADLAESVKFIIINSAEKIIQIPHFKNFMENISKNFELSWTRFIFMYKFVNAPSSLLETVKACREFNKQGLFIEVEKPRVRDLFQRIQFASVDPPEEIADSLAALYAQNSEDSFPYEKYEQVKSMATAHSQKLKKCMELIKQLRGEREENNRRQRANRRERILIVTENHATARFVRLMLVPQAGSNYRYNINTIVEYDSIEHVEKRNFEFRHGCLDVLVIDWKSIQSVIRGTVDSVIMYNRPHPNYFQTIMETEMENLTSRNCVKLKLFILLHTTEDLILIPEYIKFVHKYDKKVPQWFPYLYQRFCSRLNTLKAEREFLQADNGLVQSNLDDTLQ